MTEIGSPQKKVIIVGGGVAGLTAALALQRVGRDVVVYEANEAPSGFKGSFLTLAMNGVNALRTIDAFEPVEASGFWVSSMEFVSGSGKRLGDLNANAKGLFIECGQLAIVLRNEAMRRGIRCETRKQLLDAHTTQDGVSAHFADGTSVSDDPAHALKHLVHPEAETWVYQYRINWDEQIEASLTS